MLCYVIISTGGNSLQTARHQASKIYFCRSSKFALITKSEQGGFILQLTVVNKPLKLREVNRTRQM